MKNTLTHCEPSHPPWLLPKELRSRVPTTKFTLFICHLSETLFLSTPGFLPKLPTCMNGSRAVSDLRLPAATGAGAQHSWSLSHPCLPLPSRSNTFPPPCFCSHSPFYPQCLPPPPKFFLSFKIKQQCHPLPEGVPACLRNCLHNCLDTQDLSFFFFLFSF